MPSYFSQFTSKDGIWKRRPDGAPKYISPSADSAIAPAGVIPQGSNMESKAEQLAGTLVEGFKAFEKKVDNAITEINASLKEGHEVVDAAVDHVKKFQPGVASLKAALARLTNGGPPLDQN